MSLTQRHMLLEFKLELDGLFDEHHLLNIAHQFYFESRLDALLGVDVKNLELLYQASRDGWNNQTFKARCWYRGPTVTIVTLHSGHMLGGVTSGTCGM